MKKSLTIPALITAVGLTAAVPAHAELKVGFVDMGKIFQSYTKTKESEQRLNEARDAAKKEFEERVESGKAGMAAINKLNEEIQKPELSKEAREKKAKERDQKIEEIQKLEREVNEFRVSREKNLQQQAARARGAIVDEIRELVDERAKRDQYDLVFDKSGMTQNGVPAVLFSKDTNDFSDDIIEALNKRAASSGTAKPAASEATPAKKK